MTLLAAPIVADSLEEADRAIRLAKDQGAELLELRLDMLPAGAAGRLPALASLPVLATCRDRAEGGGGAFEGGDLARAEILKEAESAGADYLDFELAAWNRSSAAREMLRPPEACEATGEPAPAPCPGGQPRRRCGLILSAHDFSCLPADLKERVEVLWNSPADVAKIVYRAGRITDCFPALDVLHEAAGRKPTIALAMGEAGVATRLLAKKLGGFCTFAATDQGHATAPGQPTLTDIKSLYRWDGVGPATRLFGVIGCPVAHSTSPAIHNAAFGAADYDGLYLPLLVEPSPETFDGLLDGIRTRNSWLNFRGLSVTIPHKENALRYVEANEGAVEPLSRRIGAINTIRFEEDGSLCGRNTDYAAALDAVCDNLRCGRSRLVGKLVAVLGAGGVARAIVAGFTDAGAKVTIFNRTFHRAERLAQEFGCQACPFDDRTALAAITADIIINATSIGMYPDVDRSPLPPGTTRAGQLVFDTVYNPSRTRLLQEAEFAGARTVDGVAMFVRQAAAQFEFWTGKPAPIELMRQVVMARLT